MKKRVLILCTGNSARSQMAQGLLRHEAADRFEVESGGTKPGHVRPEAITVMKGLRLPDNQAFFGRFYDRTLQCDRD
jgi:protein-tyrosine-phosphatase